MRFTHAIFLAWFVVVPATGVADPVNVAVAANFAVPAKRIAQLFTERTGQGVVVSPGSTGKLYAQIANGAPFDALLSADAATPQRLEREGHAVKGSVFVYAVGRLVLWSATPGLVDGRGEVLRQGGFRKLAIANPKLAPYGAAAQQTMENLGVWTALQTKLVLGENIGQTLQFVASGNADVGFVALSQLREPGVRSKGSSWIVPATLHAPLRQEAVLLSRAASNVAARQFFDFLRGPQARELIRSYGYEVP